MKGSCREYTLLRSEKSSRVRGWIRGNTKIGPVLDVKVCYHQGHYGLEIMVESLFRDRTVSWVRIVNGINKYVTEASEEFLVASVENRGTSRRLNHDQSRLLRCLLCLFLVVNPGKFSQGCFEVSKFKIRLLRHDDTVHQEDGGAVRFDDLTESFRQNLTVLRNGQLRLG